MKPQNQDERIERLMAENERLRAVIREAQEAIEHYHTSASGSIDLDGVLARLRAALGRPTNPS